MANRLTDEERSTLDMYRSLTDDELLDLLDEDIAYIEDLERREQDTTSVATPADSGSELYTPDQRANLKKYATEGLKNLYKSDFDKLLANRDKLAPMLGQAKLLRLQYNGGDTRYKDADKYVTRLEKAISLLDSYDAIQNASSDQEIELLLNGTFPGTGAQSPFLKQVMPSAEYKTFELEGKDLDPVRGFFPEATRRAERGAGAVGTVIGGIKDVMRLPGRALRPFAKDLFGTADPNISYWEEFARPDKYKTGAEEVFDEVAGFQGYGGALGRKLATGTAKAFPPIASGANKFLNFSDPARTVYRGIGKVGDEALDILGKTGKSGLTRAALSGLAKESPSIGLDVAYEATRAVDEEGTPWATGIGGVIGAGLARPIIGGIGAGLERAGLKSSDATKELLSGSRLQLQDELGLARSVMPEDQLTSIGGKEQLAKFQQRLPVIRTQLANERTALGSQLSDMYDAQTGDDVANLLSDASRRQPAGGSLDDMINAAGEAYDANRKYNMFDAPEYRYLDKIYEAHPSKRSALLDEFTRETKVDFPTKDNLVLMMANALRENNIPDSELARLRELVFDTDIATAFGEFKKVLNKYNVTEVPQAFKGAFESPFDINEAVETRTKFRKYGEGEGPYGTQRGLFDQAESIQKETMNDILANTKVGQEIQAKYTELAKNFGLDEKLASMTDGTKVDSFFSKIANSRLNLQTKANAFAEAVDLQNRLNRASGLKEDFITPAILRQLQSTSFWQELAGTPELTSKIVKMTGSWFKEGVTQGKIRSFVAQVENLVNDTPERKRQRDLPKRSEREEMVQDISQAKKDWQEYIKNYPSGVGAILSGNRQ